MVTSPLRTPYVRYGSRGRATYVAWRARDGRGFENGRLRKGGDRTWRSTPGRPNRPAKRLPTDCPVCWPTPPPCTSSHVYHCNVTRDMFRVVAYHVRRAGFGAARRSRRSSRAHSGCPCRSRPSQLWLALQRADGLDSAGNSSLELQTLGDIAEPGDLVPGEAELGGLGVLLDVGDAAGSRNCDGVRV